MTLRELMKIDTPCQSGLDFIDTMPQIKDMEMADLWDTFRDSQWDFRGWCVKHAPMSLEKVRALKLVRASGALENDRLNHDKSVSDMCFGWMNNPYRGVS